MKLQMRFTLFLFVAAFFIIMIAVPLSYKSSESEAQKKAYDTCYRILASVEASRAYVRETLRPVIKKIVNKKDFIPEAMSASFVARNQFEIFLKKYPNYLVKFASINPRNPINQADKIEIDSIKRFEKNPNLEEWHGVTNRNNVKFYTVAKPFRFKTNCMLCHSDPQIAPDALVKTYGDKNGFWQQVGDVTMYSISVPIEVAYSEIWRHAYSLVVPIFLFVFLILLISSQLFKFMVSKPIANFSEGIKNLSKEDYQVTINEKESGELKELAIAFNIMTTKLLKSDKIKKRAEDNLHKAHDELDQRVKKRTKELTKVNEELRLQSEIMINMAEGVYLARAEDGIIVFANPKFEEMFGYKPKEIFGEHVSIINAPIDKEPAKTAAEIRGGIKKNGMWLGEVNNIKKDGTPICCSVSISEFEHKQYGKVLVSLHVDITDQKNVEAQLQQAQKMETIGTLAGGIAHDFNNILFPIVGHAEMLLEDIPDDSPLRESSNEILTSALRAKDLVKQILTFSRQEKGELKLMRIQPILKEVLKLIRSTIPSTIDISQDIQPDCGLIKADPTQIHQILMNLTTNSYHAMENHGGKLTIKLKEIELDKYELINPVMTPGSFACLVIADKGIGMDQDVKDKIFNPFFTTKGKGKGTGMGLSVVHGIVSRMKGGIQVFSEPGKGTEFFVYFPIEKSSLPNKEYMNQTVQGGPEHVLLVDDEESIINMQRNMLERLGYKVTTCLEAIKALEAFRGNPGKFDVVITDFAMPNMPGDKLVSELLKIRQNIPIIMNTGFSDKMTPEVSKKIGIKAILMKPMVKSELAQTIRKVLEK